MDEKIRILLSGMLDAYREYDTVRLDASRSAWSLLFGAAMSAAVLAFSEFGLPSYVAVAGLLTLVAMHVRSVGRRCAALARFDAVLSESAEVAAKAGRTE